MSTTPKPPAGGVAGAVQTAITVAGLLVPEAGPALKIFGLLEPEIQKGIVALIHRGSKKQLTAQDYLALAEQATGETRGT
jgi:hypothetical protein